MATHCSKPQKGMPLLRKEKNEVHAKQGIL
jgi:hypothetical protein